MERLYAKMAASGLKPGTVHQTHRTLRTALNEVVRRDHIVKNPVLLAKVSRLADEEIEPFTVDEARSILKTATKKRNGARWVVALALGLRKGEALGLQWRTSISMLGRSARDERFRLGDSSTGAVEHAARTSRGGVLPGSVAVW